MAFGLPDGVPAVCGEHATPPHRDCHNLAGLPVLIPADTALLPFGKTTTSKKVANWWMDAAIDVRSMWSYRLEEDYVASDPEVDETTTNPSI
jgi:hypothetical protein